MDANLIGKFLAWYDNLAVCITDSDIKELEDLAEEARAAQGAVIGTIRIHKKDPDLLFNLELTDEQRDAVADRYFEFSEYYTVDLAVDAELNVIAARFIEKGATS